MPLSLCSTKATVVIADRQPFKPTCYSLKSQKTYINSALKFLKRVTFSGWTEIENVQIVSDTIFNFSTATKECFSNLNSLFSSTDHCSKKVHSDFSYVVI